MIEGDIVVFLRALGSREGDPRLEQAVAFVGGQVEVDAFVEAGVEEKYLVMTDRGVDFLLRDGTLTTVFVYATDTDDQSTYDGWRTLVHGVGADSSRDDIVAALGEPTASTDAFVRYETDAGFVQFDFVQSRLEMLVAMQEVIGGSGSVVASANEAVGGAEFARGDLAVFASAIGRPMFSPEHFAVIDLAGPATESYDEQRDGVAWQYEVSSRTGVSLEFREEILVSASIRLGGDDGEAAYPAADALVHGLPLPATRDAIRAHFGSPSSADDSTDRYATGERVLRIDFVADRSVMVAVILPGAAPS